MNGTQALRQHLGAVVLLYRRWHEGGRSTWQRAEQIGFHTAFTYDHLSWRTAPGSAPSPP